MRRSRDNRTPEVLALRAELEKRNIYPHQLAAALGIHPRNLENELARGMRNPLMQVRVEDHLGMPFWSGADEFASRQRLTRILGVDPWLLSVRELHRRATDARLPGRGYAATKAALIELLASHLSAAVPSPTLPPPSPVQDHVDHHQEAPI